MSSFTCKCGAVFKEGEEPKDACGLLKSLSLQAQLESYQANELAKLITLNEGERRKWVEEKFGPDYPNDLDLHEVIEDFLYKSHREDGCTATFLCPNCGRIGVLYDVREKWKFYARENYA